MTLNEALEQAIRAYPDREAIISRERRITYRELGEQVALLTSGLRRLGIRKGDKVGLIVPNRPQFVSGLFTLFRMGAVVVPINPQLQRREMQHVLSDSEAAALITLDKAVGKNLAQMITELRPELPDLRHLIVVGEERPSDSLGLEEVVSAASPTDAVPEAVTPDDLAGLIYTSGTTGLPKGSMHTQRNFITPVVAALKLRDAWMPKLNVESMVRMAKALGRYKTRLLKGAGKQQVWISVSGFHGITGIEVPLQIFLFGDKLVMTETFDPIEILRLVEKEKVSVLTAPPTFLSVLLKVRDFDKYDVSSLMVCGAGQAPVPAELAYEIRQRIGCAVAIGFGTTELGGSVSATSLWDPDQKQAETVGQLRLGAEAKVVDEQRNELPVGEVGELAVRTKSVMKGYYKAPEATAAVLDEDGWYYTGDLATIDERGYVRIVGRKKDMIIRAGQNIYPPEVEEYLLTNPKVSEASVLGVPGPLSSERVWAYIVPAEGAELTAAEVVEYCRGQIAAYKIPDEVRIVSELPRAHGSKVQKFKLREMAMKEEEQQRRKANTESI
jgi:acyl-CoA synthetase (AMP-forming)/AMP-acid ligase II